MAVGRRPQFFTIWVTLLGCLNVPIWQLASPRESDETKETKRRKRREGEGGRKGERNGRNGGREREREKERERGERD
jgi:hypothetical protein